MMFLAPRVLLILPDQWRRALLRAALRENGYDAVGARDIEDARRYRAIEPGRGAVQLAIVDDDVVKNGSEEVSEILASHHHPRVVLVAQATREPVTGPWSRIVRRPLSVEDIMAAVRSELPLPEEARRPLDAEDD
jgi:hypothetical protein